MIRNISAAFLCCIGCGTSEANVDDAANYVDGAEGAISAAGPACSTGGQIANSDGAEGPLGTAVVGLCRRALNCASSWTPKAPPDNPGGTPNHKLLYHVWDYGWAQSTQGDVTSARNGLLGWFDAQKFAGHGAVGNANEILTTSHYQIWLNGMTCARLLAKTYNDPALLAATGKWWREERALYDLLQRGGSIDAPGARMPEGGPSSLRDTVYAQLRHAPLTGGARRPQWWDDYYNVGAWTMRELLRLQDDLGGATSPTTAADLPNLHDPLYVRTRGADFVFEFPVMRDALDPVTFVAHIGTLTFYGKHGAVAPALTGAQVQVVPGSP